MVSLAKELLSKLNGLDKKTQQRMQNKVQSEEKIAVIDLEEVEIVIIEMTTDQNLTL